MTLDMGNTDKLAEFRAEAERLGIKVDAAVDQPLRRRIRGRAATRSSMRSRRSKASAAQAVEAIVDSARQSGRSRDLADFAARINPRAVNKRVLESLAAAGAFDEFESNRARVFAGVDTMLGRAQHAHEAAVDRAERIVRRRRHARADRLPNVEPWLPAERLKTRIRRGRLLPLRPSARRLRGRAQEAARAVLGRVLARGEERRDHRRPCRRHRGVAARAAHRAPATRWASSASPTRPAHTKRSSSRKGLAEYRDLLEPGTAVLLFLSAEVQGDEVRARIQSAEPLDAAAANLPRACAFSCAIDAPIEAVAKRLEPAPRAANGDGEVSVVLMLGRGRRSRSNFRAASRSPRRSPARSRRCLASCRSRRCRQTRHRMRA